MRALAKKQNQPQQPASHILARSNTATSGSGHQTSTRFEHDFGRIPLHAQAPVIIQPKLAVNTPGDIYEQEADRAAERVMRSPESRPRLACACGGACPRCQTGLTGHGRERLRMAHDGSGASGPSVAPSSV